MKKHFLVLVFTAIFSSLSFSQVLETSGVNNTLWTGMGVPSGVPDSPNRPGFRWYGFIDVIQARVDIGMFTIDGMLAWGALTEWTENNINDFTFVNTPLKPEHFLHRNTGNVQDDVGRRSNAYNKGDANYGNNSYYLNFLCHPFAGFDIALGTRLEWEVGPNPTFGGYTWEYNSHVHQGDLRDGTPGTVPVAGFIKYANTYAQNAIGLRYKYKDIIEIGMAIPSGFSTASPVTNLGFSITPVDFITAAFAYEALFMTDSNMYTGATIRLNKNIIIDGYFGFNNIGQNYDRIGRWGTGGAVTLSFPRIGLVLKPEIGITNYSNPDYTFALYTGGKVNLQFASRCNVGCWVSFAWGAEDESWYRNHNDPRNEWYGGFVFNIRPEFRFEVNSNHTFCITTEFQSLKDYKRDTVNSTLVGIYWKYKSF